MSVVKAKRARLSLRPGFELSLARLLQVADALKRPRWRRST